MMIKPLNEDVVKLWNAPNLLLEQWASGEHDQKVEHER